MINGMILFKKKIILFFLWVKVAQAILALIYVRLQKICMHDHINPHSFRSFVTTDILPEAVKAAPCVSCFKFKSLLAFAGRTCQPSLSVHCNYSSHTIARLDHTWTS